MEDQEEKILKHFVKCYLNQLGEIERPFAEAELNCFLNWLLSSDQTLEDRMIVRDKFAKTQVSSFLKSFEESQNMKEIKKIKERMQKRRQECTNN